MGGEESRKAVVDPKKALEVEIDQPNNPANNDIDENIITDDASFPENGFCVRIVSLSKSAGLNALPVI